MKLLYIIIHKYESTEIERNVSFSIKDMFTILQNAFAQFKTKHLTLQYFIQRGYLIMSQFKDIATALHPKRIKTHIGMQQINHYNLFL